MRKQSNLIYDLGMHKGEDSELYLSKGFSVVAVEASQSLCELVKERLKKSLDLGNLRIVHTAISNSDGDEVDKGIAVSEHLTD